jgi:aspartate carbamoyltransferase catalytic subunit
MIRLGGSVIGFAEGGSTSAQKGESLSDAMRVIGDLADVIVIRHPREGAARLAADVSAASVINGGDGSNQHPSQTLLDLFTIREAFPEIDGLHVAIAGDLKYGRTVHSLVLALAHFRVRLFLISSSSLQLPDSLCSALRKKGVKFSFHSQIEEVLSKADLLYMTRIQKERFAGEAVGNYRLKKGHLLLAKPHLKILHPLPRIDEIDREIDETPHALYFRQAAGGLFVRMALLYRLLAPPIDGEER